MSDASLWFDPEALLKEGRWLHRLAKGLVRDEHEAEDVVQSTFLTAISHPPRTGDSPRGWLARVARSFAIRSSQQRQWRARREQIAARPEAVASTADLVARTSLFRQLAGFVLELDEPYRSTVLLRFFEDVPAREIASRQQVPVATVNTRLRRALAQLRERLDHGAGGRESWRSALAVPGGALVMATKSKVAVAAVVVLIAGAIAWQGLRLARSDEPGVRLGGEAQTATPPGPADASSGAPAPVITPKRFEEPESRPESQIAAAPAAARGALVSGRVLSAEGRQPVAAELFVHVLRDDYENPVWRKATSAGATRGDGTFTLADRVAPFPDTGQVLALHDRGLDWIGFGVLSDTDEVTGLEILARPGWTLGVRVVDEQGRGIPAATVLVIPRFGPIGGPFAVWAEAPASRPTEGPLGRLAARFCRTTDAEGFARLEGLPEPRLDPAELFPSGMTDVFVFKEGLDPAKERIERLNASVRMQLVLKPHRPVVVTGTVRDADDRPVVGARVTLDGAPPVATNEAGEYRISTDRLPGHNVELECSATGYSTAQEHVAIEPGKETKLDFKILEARSITGRVLDETGSPVAGRAFVKGGGGLDLDSEVRPDGTFTVEGANSEQWWLTVVPEKEWEPPRQRLVHGGDHVEIVAARAFAGGVTIEAELVDAATGNAVDPLSVELSSRATFPGEQYVLSRPTLSRGLIRAEKVPPGPWRFWIQTAQFRRVEHDFVVRPADQNVRLRIELGEPAAIVARVVLDDAPTALRPKTLVVDIRDFNGIAVTAPGKPTLNRDPSSMAVDAANGWTARFEMVPPGVPVKIHVGEYYDPSRELTLWDSTIVKLSPGEERTIELRPAVRSAAAQFRMSKPLHAGLVFQHREPDGSWVEDRRVEIEEHERATSTLNPRPGSYRWRIEFWPLDVPPRLRVPKVIEGETTIEAGKVTPITVPVE